MGRLALVFALALAGCLARAADDQDFYRQVASVELLQSKRLQAEIKLTDAQRDKLNQNASDYSKRVATLLADGKAGKTGPVETKQGVAEAKADLKKKIIAVLTPEQIVRWGQITVQQLDVLALFDPIVVAKLGLTQFQTQKLTESWNATGTKLAALESDAKKPIVDKYSAMRPASDAERERLANEFQKEIEAATLRIKPEIEKLKKGFDTTVQSTLTDGQKKTWSAIKGPPMKA